MSAVRNSGDPLPAALLDSIRRTKLALKGPLTTPVGGGFRSVNVRLREEFALYANVRPARTLIAGGRYEDIDLVLVRENLEGLYVGFEHYIPIDGDPSAVAIASGVNTRAGSRRIAEFAFDYAVGIGRKKVTIVHKANVLKALTGIFLETAQEVAKKYEGRIAVDERIVDACAMQTGPESLAIRRHRHDEPVRRHSVRRDRRAGRRPRHGAGCQYRRRGGDLRSGAWLCSRHRGQGIANPLALLLAAALMLEHVGKVDMAKRLRRAIDRTLRDDGVRTGDLGGNATTKDMTQAIVRRLD